MNAEQIELALKILNNERRNVENKTLNGKKLEHFKRLETAIQALEMLLLSIHRSK